jgi:hypothetical protein
MNKEIKAASVDSPEFRDCVARWATADAGTDKRQAFDALMAFINAWSDERCNEAINHLAASGAVVPSLTDEQQPIGYARITDLAELADKRVAGCGMMIHKTPGGGKVPLFATPVAGWVSVEGPKLAYTQGQDPTTTGVYACRVPHPVATNITEDKFLIWFDGRWRYLGSDQNYRGEVAGWVGPLPRRLPAATKEQGNG